jgi:hypothetical protein
VPIIQTVSNHQPEETSESLVTQEDESPAVGASAKWRLRGILMALRIPLVVLILWAGWRYIPAFQARKEQDALAEVYFAECAKTLKDTSALPKVPEEALAVAVKKRPLTTAAIQAWAPQVWCEIRNKQWVAHIQFSPPTGYTAEETLGPVLAEAGYDTPSAGP